MVRRTTFALALALVGLAAGVAHAAPTKRELFGRWAISGRDPRGTYAGDLYVSNGLGAARVSLVAELTYASGERRSWSGAGWYTFGRLHCRYDLAPAPGAAGVVGGGPAPAESVLATYVPADDDGLRLAGTHRGAQGFQAAEGVRRHAEDLVDRYLLSVDPALRRRLALEVGALEDPRATGAILAAFDLDGMRLTVDPAELRAQRQLPGAVPFHTALLLAVESLLTDRRHRDSPLALLVEPLLTNLGLPADEPLPAEVVARAASRLRSLMRRGGLALMPRAETPEGGEPVAEHWIFTLSIPYGDNGLWAVVPRDGARQVYNYGFN